MASLYKKKVVVTDPATGEKVTTRSKKWWGQYRDAYLRLRRVPLSTDKLAAQSMLNELVKRAEREKAGLTDPCEEQRRRPLSQHLSEFKAYLENKDVTRKQAFETGRRRGAGNGGVKGPTRFRGIKAG